MTRKATTKKSEQERQAEAAREIERDEAQAARVRQRMATRAFRLFEVCEAAECRRAKRCARAGAPCILLYKRHYQHLLPALRRALDERLRELDRSDRT